MQLTSGEAVVISSKVIVPMGLQFLDREYIESFENIVAIGLQFLGGE